MIKDFYNRTVIDEWNRLDTHWVEFEITYKHIKNIININSVILDIGGGPGKYAFRLSKDGYSISLADLAEQNIQFSLDKSKELGLRLAGHHVVDVLDMKQFDDNSFDAILCLGPFYHLIDPLDRANAIKEIHRVVKPGGIVFCAFISNYAPILDVLKRDVSIIDKYEHKLRDWYYSEVHKPTVNSTGFPEASFINPKTIPRLFSNYFNQINIFGCESILNMRDSEISKLSIEQKEKWIELAFELSCTEVGIASSEHIVYVGKCKK